MCVKSVSYKFVLQKDLPYHVTRTWTSRLQAQPCKRPSCKHELRSSVWYKANLRGTEDSRPNGTG